MSQPVDNHSNNNNNSGNYLVISNGVETLNIHKRDLNWTNTGNHDHHYLPDFTDEWDEAIALKCGKQGCIVGIMHRKEGESFMSWLDEHRAKT